MNKKAMMNIVMSCDERLAKYIPILLASIYQNNQGITVRTFLMHTKISDEIVSVIKNYVESFDQEIVIIIPENKDFEMFKNVDPKRIDLFPVEAYYHFLAHYYLPDDVDRCIYLDIDTLCVDYIYDWYEYDFEDYFFISANRYEKKVGGISYNAFNTGCFLLNIQKLRRENIGRQFFAQKLSDATSLQAQFLGDQEFLGFAFKDFPNNGFVFNAEKGMNFRIGQVRDIALGVRKFPNLKIIHYTTHTKPWNSLFDESLSHLFVGRRRNKPDRFEFSVLTENVIWLYGLWWEYAVGTPFYDEIKTQAASVTNEIKRFAEIRTRDYKYEMLLRAFMVNENDQMVEKFSGRG